MKGNKRKIRVTDENSISNELREHSDTPKATSAEGAGVDKSFNDHIDHSQEEQQQIGLLASELPEGKGDTRTIATRLSALVPNMLGKSHYQKSFDSNSVPTETGGTTTTARAMKKMLRDDDNSSARQRDAAVDLESNEKANERSISKISCFVITLMALAAIVTLVVLLVHSPKVLDNETRCLQKSSHNYKLFSTKTLYSTALNHIGKSPTPTSLPLSSSADPNHHLNLQHDNYDKSSTKIPSVFGSPHTLESIHKKLQSQNCSLKQFHFFGRHAARTPDDKDLERILKLVKNVRSRVLNSRSKAEPATQNDQPSTTSPLSGVARTEVANGSQAVCYDPLEQLGTWNDFANPGHGNLVTKAGFVESEELASRLERMFPELFDGNQASIDFGTTDELRTAQTAISFQKRMSNFTNKACDLSQFPAVDDLDKTQAQELRDNSCYQNFLKEYHKDDLKFHKECKEKRAGQPSGPNLGVTNPAYGNFIARSVSERLLLTGLDVLTLDETRAIYDVCRYESAQAGQTSIWCQFFEKSDLEFYEYQSDVSDYYNEAYGHPNFARSACKVTKNLLDSFNKYTKNKSEKPEANFHFTHSSVIQKMIAASVDLEGDPAYAAIKVSRVLATGKDMPEERQWRTSLMSPFSANIAFSLYDCKIPSPPKGDFAPTPYKVVASLNEQPLKLTGCDEYDCDFNLLKYSSRAFKDSANCDYDKICEFNYIVT